MYENITMQELLFEILDSFENITLYELLNKFEEITKFDLTKKLKICIISSDMSTAKVKEYCISDVPLYLLNKKVIKVHHEENDIVVF